MYCDFYGLRERPFEVTADAKFLYLNGNYREALASLQYGVSERRGVVTLVGEAGTGKTTLLRKLRDDLDVTTRAVVLFNTNVTFDEILDYLLSKFDATSHNGKRLYMLERLNALLAEELRKGRNMALLVDEAQDLDYGVLEDLRLLSNLESAETKSIQIVLAGQLELADKLADPRVRQLQQRVAVNCRLLPLSSEEVADYIHARLSAAGCTNRKLFSLRAIDRIFEISSGIPRLINIVCDHALLTGYALGRRRVDVDAVNEAVADRLSVEASASGEHADGIRTSAADASTGDRRGLSQFGIIALVVVALLIGLLSVGRSLRWHDFEWWHRSGQPESRTGAVSAKPGSEPSGKPHRDR